VPLAGEDRVKLQSLQEWIAPELGAFEEEYERLLCGELPILVEISDHLKRGVGKRFRPTLLLITGKSNDTVDAQSVFAAACVELVHTATLVHDDFIDEAATRRGLPTVNAGWGASAALIMGDFLYSKVFNLLTTRKMHEELAILARTTHQMSIAEAMQLERRNRLSQTEDEYMTIIRRKTASLIEASCEIGALQHPSLSENRGRLAAFGLNVGLAFQIIDDIFDYEGDRRRLGKPVGGDWREGRITLPFIAAWGRASAAERQRILDGVEEDGAEIWPEVCEFVQVHDGLAAAHEKAQAYGLAAKDALGGLDDVPQREILAAAADYVLDRLH